jgi:uncharacterized membrane protein
MGNMIIGQAICQLAIAFTLYFGKIANRCSLALNIFRSLGINVSKSLKLYVLICAENVTGLLPGNQKLDPWL